MLCCRSLEVRLVLDRQWVIGVIVVLAAIAAVIGVVLYLDTYFS